MKKNKLSLQEEFKLYETMFAPEVKQTKHRARPNKTTLKEARTAADVEAEIIKLQQELQQLKAAEKKASYGNKLPTTVWIWDMYLEPQNKSDWMSAEEDDNGNWEGIVFETEEKALDAGWTLLCELDDENELDGDPDDYYIDAIEVPITQVTKESLEDSDLEHLI